MARRRLAACLVVPEPFRTEVDGLRRATGGDLRRLPPHITLVPPTNVRDEALPEALAVLRRAASAQPGPLELTLGAAATFAPVNRVVYLAVEGEPTALARLRELRDALLDGPLERDERRRFVPHVTLSRHLPEGDDAHALAVLGHYRAEVRMETVDLLVLDDEGRRWEPLADALLGPDHVTGRGGLETHLAVSTRLDPEALAALDAWGTPPPDRSFGPVARVVTGRRDETVVAIAGGGVEERATGAVGRVDGVAVAPSVRAEGVGRQLLGALVSELARRGAERIEVAEDADDETRSLAEALGVGPGRAG